MIPEPTPYSLAILTALNRLGKPMYAGTVPAHVIARRRTRNKAARNARRAERR